MRKILLCLEDYNELLFLETLLKKLGFSVESATNEFIFPDKLLAFLPDLVIATGDGAKINGERISRKLRKKGQHAKLLLLFPRDKIIGDATIDDLIADGAVETPVNPRRLINSICHLTGLELQIVISKFDKLPIAKDFQNPEEKAQVIHAKPPREVQAVMLKNLPVPSSNIGNGSGDRSARYAALLKDVPLSNQNTFSHSTVSSELRDIRKFEKEADLSELEEDRKKFVTALFKK